MENKEDVTIKSEEQAVAEEMSAVSKHIAEMKDMLKRPDSGGTMPLNVANMLIQDFTSLKEFIEVFSAHLRALDRKRLNGMGIKRHGFAERAYDLAKQNPEFLPHWLNVAKFTSDHDLFTSTRAAFDLLEQNREIMWNIVMEAADVYYTDGLEFYAPVKEAARRRVDAAEGPYKELFEFFEKHGKRKKDQPTEKEIKRDAVALFKGTKDGKLVLENVSPKLTGGTRKVVDETFKDTVRVTETKEE